MRATFLLHGVISGYIAHLLGASDAVIAIAFILGMMNDVVPFVDGLFFPEMRWQRYYKMFHEPKWWVWFIPFMNLHCLIDKFWHDENGWKKEAYYVEVVIWVFFIYLIMR